MMRDKNPLDHPDEVVFSLLVIFVVMLVMMNLWAVL